jgi:hypothetical protein
MSTLLPSNLAGVLTDLLPSLIELLTIVVLGITSLLLIHVSGLVLSGDKSCFRGPNGYEVVPKSLYDRPS